MSPLLEVEGLSCAYRHQVIVEALSFAVSAGQIACLLGPSGCGKTTVLRAIAGFSGIHGGAIRLEGALISSSSFTLAPEKRQMGMVFQDYALFPHLTVAENIHFGLKGLNGAKKKEIAAQMLDLVRLPDLSQRYPHELSGGQQQRVALARALAPRPKLLLMDEPFSNLDTDLRKQLSLEVRDILKQQNIAAIVVTHDQQEAFTIGDQVGILADGRLQQWGAPQVLYQQPVNALVASFVGKGELFPGRCLSETRVETEMGVLEFAEPFCMPVGKQVELFIRPSDLKPLPGGRGAVVKSSEFLGESIRYVLRLDSGREVESLSFGAAQLHIGEAVGVEIAVHRPIVFDAPQGEPPRRRAATDPAGR